MKLLEVNVDKWPHRSKVSLELSLVLDRRLSFFPVPSSLGDFSGGSFSSFSDLLLDLDPFPSSPLSRFNTGFTGDKLPGFSFFTSILRERSSSGGYWNKRSQWLRFSGCLSKSRSTWLIWGEDLISKTCKQCIIRLQFFKFIQRVNNLWWPILPQVLWLCCYVVKLGTCVSVWTHLAAV